MTTATATFTLGKFVWRELFTRDVEAAKRFYTQLFGWTTQAMPMGDMGDYTMFYNGENGVGGLMDIGAIPGDNSQMPPNWGSYVSVADVDAAAAKAVALGGKNLSDCMDIPNVGRFATIQDPQGAVLSLFRSSKGDLPDGMPPAREFCWESLQTTSIPEAAEFYKQVVGWGTKTDGGYTLFTRENGEQLVASTAPVEGGMPPHWLTYVAVGSLADTNAKARELGAEIVLPEAPVPGWGKLAILKDPTGAYFATFQPDNCDA